MPWTEKELERLEAVWVSSSYWTVYKFFASQSQRKYKIIIFFSGEAKDSVNFSFFILLHKRAKPILPSYLLPHLRARTQTLYSPLMSMRRRRRRILLPCFANAKPLPEAGNNNYLGSANATTCRRQAIYILVSIHRPYLRLLIVGAAEGGERRQTNRRRRLV